MPNLVTRTAGVAAVVGALTGLAAGPANAAGPTPRDPHVVTATCHAGPGVHSNLNTVTYAFSGAATAYSTDGSSVAVATGITCYVVDVETGAVYGSVTNAAVGPAVVIAGSVAVPMRANAKVCATGTALFSDNTTATYSTC